LGKPSAGVWSEIWKDIGPLIHRVMESGEATWDEMMWEKIELNLLSDALKSTFEGEIRVGITAAGGKALVGAADTGTGISESDLANLFERFQRIEGTRRRSHEGSGTGLALVRKAGLELEALCGRQPAAEILTLNEVKGKDLKYLRI
jgi:C4-dicarboxylate-specific signal transduction histidine kinase